MSPHDGRARRYLTVVLFVAFVLSLVGVIYLALTPQATTDPYTELYLLGPGGNASGYPTDLAPGERGTFIVGVVNHEHQAVTYVIVVEIDTTLVERRSVSVDEGERWEGRFSFSAQNEGRQRLWVRLYRADSDGDGSEAYRETWLWINVTR